MSGLRTIEAERGGVLVGDVVGHGARAATLAALARYTVRTLALQHASPRRVLAELSDTVLARGEPERFLSAVYLITRKIAHGVEVKAARGGHPPPLVRRADATVEILDVPGGLLGCQPDPGLKDVRVSLAPGDLILLYTDGVTECRRGDEQFGDARLQALLATGSPDPFAVVDRTIDAVLAHCSNDPSDDVAVLALLVT